MIAFLAVYIVATVFIGVSLYLAYQDRAAGVPPQSLKRGSMIAGTFLALLWASYFLAIQTLFTATAEDPPLIPENPFWMAASTVGIIAFALATLLAMWYASRWGWALLFYAGVVLARDRASAVQFSIQENQSFENPTIFDHVLFASFILMAMFAISAAGYSVFVSYIVDYPPEPIALNGQ